MLLTPFALAAPRSLAFSSLAVSALLPPHPVMTIRCPPRGRAQHGPRPGAGEISQLRHVTMDHVDSPRGRAHPLPEREETPMPIAGGPDTLP